MTTLTREIIGPNGGGEVLGEVTLPADSTEAEWAAAFLAARGRLPDTGGEHWNHTPLRLIAHNYITTSNDPTLKVVRALALSVLSELNTLRGWLASFKTEVAAAASLADLKTRVAGLPATPDRTRQQLVNAILAKIDDGTAD